MKKILVILCAIFAINLSAKAQLTTADSIWTVIKNETTRGANTATRVGTAGLEIIEGLRDTLSNFASNANISDSLDLAVRLTGDQTIAGKKTFSDTLIVDLISSSYGNKVSSSNSTNHLIYNPNGNTFLSANNTSTSIRAYNGIASISSNNFKWDIFDFYDNLALQIDTATYTIYAPKDNGAAISISTDTITILKPIKGYFTAAQISDSLAQTVKITGYQNIEGTKNFTKILTDTIGVSDYLSSHEITTSILGADAINSSEISTYEIETAKIKVNDTITSAFYSVSELNEAPASATSEGKTGEIRITAGFIYVCVSDDVWVRATLATW